MQARRVQASRGGRRAREKPYRERLEHHRSLCIRRRRLKHRLGEPHASVQLGWRRTERMAPYAAEQRGHGIVGGVGVRGAEKPVAAHELHYVAHRVLVLVSVLIGHAVGRQRLCC